MDQASSMEELAQLAERLKEVYGLNEDRERQKVAQKYVIYVRKSTESAEKQERSIGDQLHVCRDLAYRLGLKVEAVLEEEKSAKVSGLRDRFDEMIKGIQAGKYEGIIAWSPDRLARNMKEAGEVIDLLDKGVIKDIKFANGHAFTNEPSGKMLLGIAFVMAKQYSDQHSQNVKRSVNRITQEGKTFDKPKYGYYKDQNGFARPDDENWDLLREAFQKRIYEKKSLEDISKWLNERSFPVQTRHTRRKIAKITKNFLSDLFRDPYYTGILMFGDQIVNLIEKFDFKPMISVKEYESITEESGVKQKRFNLSEAIRSSDTTKADFIRGMVTCAACGQKMSTGLTSKKNKSGLTRYFYFRCDTPKCKYEDKSVRGKVILDAAIHFLRTHRLDEEKAYAHYLEEMKREKAKLAKEINAQITSCRMQQGKVRNDIKDTKGLMKGEHSQALRKEFRTELIESVKKDGELTANIEKLEAKKLEVDDRVLSFAEFTELFKKMANLIEENRSIAELDAILKKLFSNFVVDGKKVTEIKQNSPFGELYDTAVSAMVDLAGLEPATPCLQSRCSTK